MNNYLKSNKKIKKSVKRVKFSLYLSQIENLLNVCHKIFN